MEEQFIPSLDSLQKAKQMKKSFIFSSLNSYQILVNIINFNNHLFLERSNQVRVNVLVAAKENLARIKQLLENDFQD